MTDAIKREFRYDIPAASNKVRNDDGSLTIRDARMLASGTWTDSLQRTPCYYPADLLRANAGNWVDNGIWNRHSGGMSRKITDKIGTASNFRFVDDAVIADINLHCVTQESQSVANMVEAGLVNYVSSELSGREKWDADNKRYEAVELMFTGAAIVNRGACATCTFEASSGGVKKEDEQPVEGEIMDESEINAMIGDAKKELSANFDGRLSASLDGFVKADDIKEMSEMIDSQANVIKELEARLKVIEDSEDDSKTQVGRENDVEPGFAIYRDKRSQCITRRV